jgi:putative component of membrane protein insertase Oxa1/YidC/SpoIIIJ protein YidD
MMLPNIHFPRFLPDCILCDTSRVFHFIILFLSGILTYHCPVFSQSLSADVNTFIRTLPAEQKFTMKNEAAVPSLNLASASEIKMLFLVAIRGYQLVISSQDMAVCNFQPSCSRFSRTAFQQAGFVRGLLLTSDRLQRCNGLPGMARYYRFLPQVERFSDPVENYLPMHTHEKESH